MYSINGINIIDYNNNKYIALFIENTYGKDKFCYLYLNNKEGLNKFDFYEPLLNKYKTVYYREEDNINGYLPCIY
jgi:hypothetical protein